MQGSGAKASSSHRVICPNLKPPRPACYHGYTSAGFLFFCSAQELAARQLRDYLQGTPGTYFAEDHPPLRLEVAYGIQAEVAKLRRIGGDSIAGYKIGCVGPKIRETFGMSGSIRGFLFKSELRPTGSTVSLSNHTSLAIEGEMAVRIGVESQVACAFPVIELHNYVLHPLPRHAQDLEDHGSWKDWGCIRTPQSGCWRKIC